MKKSLDILLAGAFLLLSSCATNGDIDNLQHQIDGLKSGQIATIENQINSINGSITSLQEADREIKGYITTLQNTATELQRSINSINDRIGNLEKELQTSLTNLRTYMETQLSNINTAIENLQEKDKAIEKRIDDLKEYVDTQLKNTKDWVSATFATLEQYQGVVSEIEGIKSIIRSINSAMEQMESRLDGKITSMKGEIESAYTKAMGTLDTSLKNWVNDKLNGYWTIAETESMLNILSQKDDENLFTLRLEIESAKEDLTTAYQKEIKEAIEATEGKLSSRIDTINQELQAKISVIEDRLDEIESRLDKLEKELSIEFIDSDDLACMPGKNLRVNYKLINSDGECQIECIGENGWSGKAIQETPTSGYVIISAPISDLNGKILVFVHCSNKMAMKALYFETGVLNVSEAYNVGWQGGQIVVPVEYNIDYSIDCGNSSWVSLKEEPPTRATISSMKYLLTVDENPEDSPARTAVIQFLNGLGQQVKSITIYQELSPTSNPIVFADPYAKIVCVQKYDSNRDGEVSYYEAGKVSSIEEDFFGEYKPAVTSFDEFQFFVSIENIPADAFNSMTRMSSIKFPDRITTIGDRAFYGCSVLKNITLSPVLESIGSRAFSYCKGLETFSFPNSLKVIGEGAFANCTSLQKIQLNEGLETIENGAFYFCQAVETVYVPTSLKSIRNGFSRTTGKAEIHGVIPSGTIDTGAYRYSDFSEIVIGDDVTSIGNHAFYQSHNTTKVTIGKNVASLGGGALSFYNTKPVYYFRRFLPVNNPPSDYSKFFVPQGSKEIYMAAQGWPSSDNLYEEYVVE